MASDKPRREIPFDEEAPAFNVRSDDPDAARALPHFSKAHVYCLGSSSRCGCDFKREPDWVHELAPEAERQKVERNQRQLHAYLQECLVDEESVELFGYWDEGQDKAVTSRRSVRLDELLSEEFFFDENEVELILVTR
jgi:hypothetical protein